jgi:hypothetical protein
VGAEADFAQLQTTARQSRYWQLLVLQSPEPTTQNLCLVLLPLLPLKQLLLLACATKAVTAFLRAPFHPSLRIVLDPFYCLLCD